MPVQAATRVNRSTGNGVTTVFPYTFKLISQSHIRVTVDGVVKTIATDYTVSGVGDAGGGNVTFTSAPANLAAVVLSGSAPYSRSTDYVRNGSFQEETVDNDFDLAVILMQQLDERQGRAIAIPIDDATGTDVELPVAADRASKYLAFDADGNPVATSGTSSVIVVSTFAETLLDDADAAAMRATLGAFASAGGNLSGMIVEAEGAAVASAASCNIWATDGNTCHITGTTQIDDFATAPQAGAWKKVVFDDALILNQSANLNLNGGGADITTEAGDMAFVYADTTTQMDVFVVRKSGREVAPPTPVISTPYDSGNLTIALAGAHTLTHSLGGVPKIANLLAKCISAGGDAGYAQDDVIVLGTNSADANSANVGVSVRITATQIILRVGGGSGNTFSYYPHATTGVINGLDYTKWALIVRAYA